MVYNNVYTFASNPLSYLMSQVYPVGTYVNCNASVAGNASIASNTGDADITKEIDMCLLDYIGDTDIRETPDNDFKTIRTSKLILNKLVNGTGELEGVSSNVNAEKYTLDGIKNRLKEIKKYRKELKELLKLPLMKQRTEEWFEARKTRLTASDLYDALKGGNVSIRLAKKKANIVVDNINYNAIPALKWGTMFEPMATRCYSQKMKNVTIHDFGLICDANNSHFGASPDGINDLGIMLEIKCPYSRKITDGVIPEKYKMQIQGQLAVCKLKECDYIECIFKTMESEEEYLALDNGCGDPELKHGVIAEFYNSKGEYVYYYSESNKTPIECIKDIQIQVHAQTQRATDVTLRFSKYTYWRLDEMIIQRVVFNGNEWETISPKIDTFWEQVEEYKLQPLIPIEIGIKKYNFIDDDDDDAADAAK
jgi:putative phage-type endonuclease